MFLSVGHLTKAAEYPIYIFGRR